ncbi:response regulator [Sphingomonas histidinilytica]|uniref:Response regulator receiver domain-containing protein n=1 Tax=Rhizorhabdus histidinilytica TaxID=439228 RepID=A0A1T5CT98_9SPHN|nr:response regulator [Rhizorhabdus histidinilytica]MBO9379103.1 response regulator [Rhizorhabdus histidinilytica]SKB62553.1 Response regulator receiver domain-containing protein [Rhizorhabdus histidinilytica]
MQGRKNSARGKATVLVVEDELFVRMIAVDAIEDAGYATIEAQDADQALILLEVHDEIDLVFTDIKMPGTIDGLGLALRVRERWPGLPLILTSGHLRQEDATVPASVPFLQKPYRAATLLAELARLLD